MHKYRIYNCGELTSDHIDKEVKLSGWVHRKRDHGNLIFIDLRDHYGITQIVIDSDNNSDLVDKSSIIKNESVITVIGKVAKRDDNSINNNIKTGTIEIIIKSITTESESDVLPFSVNSSGELSEELRLKYRFLDLRREKIHSNMILRSNIIKFIRDQMHNAGFMEFQTPILTASSPEGARDYLVPSRVHPGKFYALPQAPQQFKQLLMISGFDKYFQIAPCFRDEDGRADRSPGEFYQLDIEMSFVTQEDIFSTIEPILHSLFTKFSKKSVNNYPFPRISYNESMLKYGSDKPDLRNPIIISDVCEIFKESDFAIFKKNIESGQIIRAIPAPNTNSLPRSFFDRIAAFAIEQGAPGLGYISFTDNGDSKGPIAKFLNSKQIDDLKNITNTKNGDTIFFVSNYKTDAEKLSNKIRTMLGTELGLIDYNRYEFCWITDFPFYEWNDEKKSIDFTHNPFSMPQGGLEVLENAKTREDFLNILAYQYDIVCNGIELSSGGIRNHKPEIMYKAFSIAGYSTDDVDKKFGGMIKAFNYGAPPHGGIAPGIDRMVMLIADEPNIREVIAFPMNQQAQDLLMNAPSSVDDKQLKELNIQIKQ